MDLTEEPLRRNLLSKKKRHSKPGGGTMGLRWSYLVIFAFIVLLVVGLSLGEFRAVLANAATICLSCIGIG